MTDEQDYEIGYGKPPRHTRFRKGQSGNPRGRPKGSRNFASELDEILNAPVPVTENGRKTQVSTRKAVLLRLREKALKGDPRAIKEVLGLIQGQEATKEAAQAERGLSRDEVAILKRFEAEIRAGGTLPPAHDRVVRNSDGDEREASDEPQA